MSPTRRSCASALALCAALLANAGCKTNDVLLGADGPRVLDASVSATSDAARPRQDQDAALDADCGATGGASDAGTTGSGSMSACGLSTCRAGLVCCSASCGLCTIADSCNPIDCKPPTTDCTAADCGPTLGVPMTQTCSDGSSVAMQCARDAHGTCVWVEAQCPVRVQLGIHCGGNDPAACGADHYCDLGGTSGCASKAQGGTCAPLPSECPTDPAPVCGCDGQTYRNACLAASQRVGVDHSATCSP